MTALIAYALHFRSFRLNSAGSSAIAASLLSLVLVLGGCSRDPDSVTIAPQQATVPVAAVTAQLQPLNRELVAVGSLRSDESVTLSSEIAGRVARVNMSEGLNVKRGQVLFELDDAIYRAEFDQAQANLGLMQRNHQRAVELNARKLIAASDLDSASANLQVARATLALARARLEKTRIVAPFDGISGLRRVSPGEYVAVGQALASLEAVSVLKVDFRLPEGALPALQPGQTLTVELDAFPNETFAGELYAIEPRVADDTRSIGLRARLANPDLRLRPGLFARVRLQVGTPEPTLMIPEQAIFPRGSQQFVYVIEDGHAAQREIQIGQRSSGRVAVLSGLVPGTQVITVGLQRLVDGAAVEIREPTAAMGD